MHLMIKNKIERQKLLLRIAYHSYQPEDFKRCIVEGDRQLNMLVFCFRVMQLALVLVLIIVAIFIIVMLMTFVFHVLVFNMRFLVPLTTTEKIDRHQILSKDPILFVGMG